MTPRFQEGLKDSPLDEQGWHGTSTAMATRCVNSALSPLSPLFGSSSVAFIPLPVHRRKYRAVDGSSQNKSDPCLEGKRAPEQTKVAKGRINTLLEAENIWGQNLHSLQTTVSGEYPGKDGG